MVRRLQNKDSNTIQNYRREVYSFVLWSRQLCIYPIKNSMHWPTFIDVRIKKNNCCEPEQSNILHELEIIKNVFLTNVCNYAR